MTLLLQGAEFSSIEGILNEKTKNLHQFSASVVFRGREDFYMKSIYKHVEIVKLITNVISALTVEVLVVTLAVRNSKFRMTTSF